MILINIGWSHFEVVFCLTPNLINDEDYHTHLHHHRRQSRRLQNLGPPLPVRPFTVIIVAIALILVVLEIFCFVSFANKGRCWELCQSQLVKPLPRKWSQICRRSSHGRTHAVLPPCKFTGIVQEEILREHQRRQWSLAPASNHLTLNTLFVSGSVEKDKPTSGTQRLNHSTKPCLFDL